MFTTEIRGQKRRVWFRHCQFNPPEKIDGVDVKGFTTCLIEDKEYGASYLGGTLCSIHDKFIKSQGRKISLKRVMDSMNLTREERRRVWKDYWASQGHTGV